MEKINPIKTIILHPQVAELLSSSFDMLIRDNQYIDSVSCEIGTHYMEIEAIFEPHQIVTTKILIPHSMILAVVDSSEKSKMGFEHTKENKEEGSH